MEFNSFTFICIGIRLNHSETIPWTMKFVSFWRLVFFTCLLIKAVGVEVWFSQFTQVCRDQCVPALQTQAQVHQLHLDKGHADLILHAADCTGQNWGRGIKTCNKLEMWDSHDLQLAQIFQGVVIITGLLCLPVRASSCDPDQCTPPSAALLLWLCFEPPGQIREQHSRLKSPAWDLHEKVN